MSEDHDRAFSANLMFIAAEEAASRGTNLEHIEVRSRHELPKHALAASAFSKAQGRGIQRGRRHTLETSRMIAQVLEGWIRHVVEPGAIRRAADIHEPIGLAHTGAVPQQNRVSEVE